VDRTYPVIWTHGANGFARGRLELGHAALRLVGTAADESVSEEIGYREIADVRVGRRLEERIDGHPSLVVERPNEDRLCIASVADVGVIGELARRIAELQRSHVSRRAVVVVPLLPDSREAVQALLAQGPPFDPEALRLERHSVFLTADEAIFLFSWRGDASIEALLAEPGLWESAATWNEYIAGPPRIGEPAYVWSHANALDEALLPPGLHRSDQ
jgi:hypothetical protein